MSLDDADAGAVGDIVEDGAELGVVVSQKELGSMSERRQFSKLLGEPQAAWSWRGDGAKDPEERRPALALGRHAPEAAQVALNGALGDGDAELEELAADALGAPEPILDGHAADEPDDVSGQPGARGVSALSFRRDMKRKRSRCQRRSVSGLTSTRSLRQTAISKPRNGPDGSLKSPPGRAKLR